MASQFFYKKIKHKLSIASITDTTPPTFSGISSLTANANGSFTANATAATDTSNPIRYEAYVSTTNVGLFNTANIAVISTALPIVIFTDANGDVLENIAYYVGMRAVDAVGNRETNTASIQETSEGVPDNSVINKLDQILAKTNNLPADPASETTVLTRLANSSYTAPDNSTIADIETAVLALNDISVADIEASTVLAKENTLEDIKVNTNLIPAAL